MNNNVKKFEILLEPALLLADNVLHYSEGFAFPDNELATISSCRSTWADIRTAVQEVVEFASGLVSNPSKSSDVSYVTSNLRSIEINVQVLVANLFSMTELREIEYEPATEEVDTRALKNSHAIRVIERVREKLQGTGEPESELVARLIAEATSSKNLCQMFEGFMGWI
jgi:FATC domain